MKPTIHLSLSCLITALCTIAPARAAVSYDAVADFSLSQNTDTSTWSYRYQTGTARDGVYTLLPAYGPSNAFSPVDPGLWTLEGKRTPAAGVNQTGSDAYFIRVPDFLWPNGAMLIHPGPANLVVVSWLSPISALVNIDFSFSDLDPVGSGGVNWFVERNNSSGTLSAGSFGSGGTSGPLSVTGVAVSAGDRINFIVDPAANYAYDSTRLTASIMPVPEPSTLSGMRRLDSGAFAFTLAGPPGIYTVLVSQGLDQWREMSRVTNEIGFVQLIDPTATNRARGFYRAMRE